MSEVFEAICVRAGVGELSKVVCNPPEASIMVEVGDLALLVLAVQPNRMWSRTQACESAAEVSRVLEVSVYLAYDSRSSEREAVVFKSGIRAQEFGPRTETWHPLREDGEPDASIMLNTSELAHGVEYETADDAISQGIAATGSGVRMQAVVQAVCYPANGRQ